MLEGEIQTRTSLPGVVVFQISSQRKRIWLETLNMEVLKTKKHTYLELASQPTKVNRAILSTRSAMIFGSYLRRSRDLKALELTRMGNEWHTNSSLSLLLMNYVKITTSIAHDHHFFDVTIFHSEYLGSNLSPIHHFTLPTSITTSSFIYIYSASPRHIFIYFHYTSREHLSRLASISRVFECPFIALPFFPNSLPQLPILRMMEVGISVLIVARARG